MTSIKSKKAIIVYSKPFTKVISGTNNRVMNILKVLKEFNIVVDELVRYRKNRKTKEYTGDLVDKIIYMEELKIPFFKQILNKIKINKNLTKREKKFYKQANITEIYDLPFLIDSLKNYIDVNDYDYAIAVNSNNAFWVDSFSKKTKKILLMEDPMFNQFRDRFPKHLVDEYLEDYKNYEATIINKFDSIIGISQSEINIFKNEQNKDKFIYIPAFMESKNIIKKNYKYDIIYVAHDNIHNINGIKWFLDNVYPKLNNLKFLFIGEVCINIKNKEDYKNIDFIDFIENIDEAYNEAKISICPMFSGTGLKIKVVEAFAYGKPVVCSQMGLVGQPNSNEIINKAIFVSDNPEIFARNIYTLLENQKLYDDASKAGLKYFNKYFLKDKNIDKLKKIFTIEK